MSDYQFIKSQDEKVYEALAGEVLRQQTGVELIPSENYASRAVREANGSILTNKYSEGYPGKRYYGGQEFTDVIETLAIERAKELFGCGFANVQPHAGAPANIATYFALLEPGDTIMGMDLSHGGHLTHGHPVTYITKIFNFVRYKMKNPDTGEIDYEDMLKVAKETKPKVIMAGFSAYSRELDYEQFVKIGREVGAVVIGDVAHIAGLIAGGALKNPFDAGFDVLLTTTHKTLRGPRGGMILTREDADIAKKINKEVFPGFQGGPIMSNIAGKAVAFKEALQPSFKDYATQVIKNAQAMAQVFKENEVRLLCGGTDNHLVLADVYGSLGITGQEAEVSLDEVGITLNKNMIADDPRSPMDPSGIRFGTPAMTTRGMKEAQAIKLSEIMLETLQNKDDAQEKAKIKRRVEELCLEHPIPEVFN